MTLKLPKAPITKDNEAIHRSLQDVVSFLRQIFNAGAKHPEFNQTQIDSFTDRSFLGTILFNQDTGASNISYLDNDEVKWREI
jgi:hypothetical protein